MPSKYDSASETDESDVLTAQGKVCMVCLKKFSLELKCVKKMLNRRIFIFSSSCKEVSSEIKKEVLVLIQGL